MVRAGELGAVAGHEARVGRHVVHVRWPARGALLREADHAVRPEDAHGPGRHPQELGPQRNLHVPPQLRSLSLMDRTGLGHVLSARMEPAKWSNKGRPTWQASRSSVGWTK